ncbi:MAG: chorismate synthase [Alphaproteobacteria bacterium]|nr:chorismate synthase [Alphaproteobacteria bacterium]MCB9796253.1 chorismate synthase [Alphaproteobacteria bacterium]
MGSSTGRIFRVTTWGESHGGALGAVVEGCPPGMVLDLELMQRDLDRRRPGQSKLTTQRKEPDQVQVLSGLFEGRTLGTALSLVVFNQDADPRAYAPFKDRYRPSHADFTYEARYGLRNWQGGGRASARETLARVAAGAVARQVLAELAGVEILAWVDQVGELRADVDPAEVSYEAVEANLVRCPDPEAAAKMEALIREVRAEGDTIGGVVRCVARGVPAGLGDPVFDKLEADLAKAMLSLPAAKGFESGSGFGGVAMRGSAHNDPFVNIDGQIRTESNHSGGVQGGISNGMPITLAVAFKPVATIFKEQRTVDREGRETTVKARGRHDPCVVPRAVPIVEAGVALVLCDHLLRWRAIRGER